MLIIRTLNSEYSIKAEGDRFRITKIATLPHGNRESRVISDGESRLSLEINISVGRSAVFAGYDGSPDWHTSKVLEIREGAYPPTPVCCESGDGKGHFIS